MTRFNPRDADVAELLELQPTLHTLAARVLAGRDGSDDAVQDVWVAVLQRAGLTRVARPRGLARLIDSKARAKAQRETRRRHHERRAGAAQERTSPSAASAVERAEVRRVVLEEVLALDPHLCEVLVLRFVEERSTEEVASLLGIAQATVRTRVHRALPQLRERLERRFGGGGESWLAALAPLALATLPQAVGGKAGASGAGAAALVAAVLTTVWAVFLGIDRRPSATRPSALDETVVLVEPMPSGERVPVPAEGLAVGGVVVGPKDGKVDGALVPVPRTSFALTVRRGFDTLFEGSFETDGQGRFALRLEDRGPSTRVDVTITRDNIGPWRALRYASRLTVQSPRVSRVLEGDQRSELVKLRVQLVAKGDLVVGVEDSRGAPIEGAKVRLLRKGRQGARLEPIFTDEAGHAVLRQVDDYELLSAEAAGYVLAEGAGGEKLEAGGFEPAVLLMAQSATLRVELPRSAGHDDRAGIFVSIGLSPTEPLLAGNRWGWVAADERTEYSEDEEARFEGVPAGRRLALTFSGRPGVPRGVATTAHAWGELVLDPRLPTPDPLPGSSSPIILEPGGETVVRLKAEPASPVEERSARIHAESGAPLKVAFAQLYEVPANVPWNPGAGYRRAPLRLGSCRTGTDPSELTLIGPFDRAPGSDVVLLARAVDVGGDWWRADEVLPPGEPDVDAVQPLQLILRKGSRISGVVNDGGNSQYCLASRRDTPGVFRQMSGELNAGRFESAPLAPGPYELFIRPKDVLCFESLGTFEAGSRDLKLSLLPRTSHKLRVSVEAGESALERVWIGVMHCAGDRPSDATPAALGSVVTSGLAPTDRELLRSPPFIPQVGGSPVSVQGRWVGAATAELRSPAAGWLLVVAGTSSEDDVNARPGPTRAASSGWFHHRGGALDLRFDLEPAANVTGHIAGHDVRTPLRVAVLDGRGRHVQIRGGGTYGDSLPVAANGRFRIDDAPVGNVRLQFGTRAELDAGRPRKDFPVALVQGPNPPLELE